MTPEKADVQSDQLNRWLNVIGRLSPGSSRALAEAQLNTVWWNWRRDVLKIRDHNIRDKKGWLETHLAVTEGGRGMPLLEERLGRPIKILEGMALLVLLIACGNVTNLLLAKAVRKHSELAVRGALGASRSQIFQQVLAEGLLLGLLGAASGLFLGWVSLRLLLRMVPATNSLHDVLAVQLDWRVIVLSAVAGGLTSLIFTVAPAILSMRTDPIEGLRSESRTVIGGSGRLRNFLVAGEIALSLVLLTGATAFSWNLYQLRENESWIRHGPHGHVRRRCVAR